MKQNITVSLDAKLLKQARALAAKRRVSVSRLLADELGEQVRGVRSFEQARKQALAWLEQRFSLGGKRVKDRASLHDRPGLR